MEARHNTVWQSLRLSLPPLSKSSAVCLEAYKAWDEKKLSKQFNICSQRWHEVTPPAQLLYLSVVDIITTFRAGTMFVRVKAAGPWGWASFTTAGSDCVWSSHFYVSNQLCPPGGSALNKPAVESVFVLKGSANRAGSAHRAEASAAECHHHHQLDLWHTNSHTHTSMQIYNTYCATQVWWCPSPVHIQVGKESEYTLDRSLVHCRTHTHT